MPQVPAQLVGEGYQTIDARTRWPEVFWSDWCGEFAPKEPALIQIVPIPADSG